MYLCTSYQLFVINKSSAQNIKYLFEASVTNWSRRASDVSGEMVMHIYFHGVYHHNGWSNLTHVISYTICLYKSILQVARYIDRIGLVRKAHARLADKATTIVA
uniref:Uncharacterized protein n=1 Tax=Trichogramma kaykai TaxID=54128 RepID=A0ABD2X9U4_9HYME